MKFDNGLDIELKSWTIGPRHDPYGAEEIIIKRGEYQAGRYSDGLGRNKVSVWQGEKLLVSREWFHESGWNEKTRANNRCNALYANLIVKKYLGITCDDAHDLYHESYVEDPYGPSSRYI